MKRQIIIAIMTLLCWFEAGAQDEEFTVPDTGTVHGTAVRTSGIPFFKPGGLSLNIYAGNYEAADDPQFVGIRDDYSLGLGLSADLNSYPNLALDVELFAANRDFDTPVGPPTFGSIDNDTSIDTTALLVGGRLFYPARSPFRVYAAAGVGYFSTRMIVHGSIFGFPARLRETERSVEFYYGAGIGYMFGRWGLGLDYRHFDLDGSFADFNISNADLGGDLFLVGLRISF